MSISIDSTNRILIDGSNCGLAVVQRGDGTVVYTPESRVNQMNYKEHALPSKRYSLAHDAPNSGVPERAQFESDVKALLRTIR